MNDNNTTTKVRAGINVQRHAFQLTLNNPSTHGYDHTKIKEILIIKFPTLRYFCMADEVGERGTPHTHIYVAFNSRVRVSTIKNNFPEAHIEVAYGSVQSNLDYIKKVGRWAETEKAETRVEGSYEEYGTVPVQKGKNIDMAELYELVKAGYSNAEILALNNDYILNLDKIDKVRTTLLIDKYKNVRRLDLKVIYIYGATGTGKTRGVLDEHGDANVYRTSDYNHPFDHYECQPVIVFDEYRSHFSITDMLNYLDIYPLQLPARYSNKYACYEIVYIISNEPLENQHKNIQEDQPESWNAMLRRISEVRVYNRDGKIDVYDSVDKYLNRNCSEFKPLNEEDENIVQEQLHINEKGEVENKYSNLRRI